MSDQDSSLVRLRISTSLQGNYEDLRRFIYQVESGTDFIVIDSIALRQGSRTRLAVDAGPQPVHVLPRETRWALSGSAKSSSPCSRLH